MILYRCYHDCTYLTIPCYEVIQDRLFNAWCIYFSSWTIGDKNFDRIVLYSKSTHLPAFCVFIFFADFFLGSTASLAGRFLVDGWGGCGSKVRGGRPSTRCTGRIVQGSSGSHSSATWHAAVALVSTAEYALCKLKRPDSAC